LEHPNIIKYLDSEIIDGTLFIYLEYISGGSIKYILDKYGIIKENLIKLFLKQILEGLSYLHSRGIVHRDIKAGNILLDIKGNIKLSDFGCSGICKPEESNTLSNSSHCELLQSMKGTLPWMAPEVVLQKKYGKKADVWSLGCTLIEMATASPPWGKLENCYQTMRKIGRTQDIPEIPSTLSKSFQDFILLCLNRDPKQRPKIKDLKEHEFLK
jgi:serine/threonine protein kinase